MDKEELHQKVNEGLSLVNFILQLAKEKLTEEAKIDNNGDVELLNLEDLFFFIYEDEKLGDAIKDLLKQHYEQLSEQVTYEERVAWSDQRELERTDRAEYNAEKNRIANKINRKFGY